MEIVSFFSDPTPLKELVKGSAFLPELGLHPRNVLFLERKGKTKTKCFYYSSEYNEHSSASSWIFGKGDPKHTYDENSIYMQ